MITLEEFIKIHDGDTQKNKPIPKEKLTGIYVELCRQNCFSCEVAEVTTLTRFSPADPETFGAEKGMNRIVWYGLCDDCLSNCHTNTAYIEEKMKNQLTLGRH